MSNITKPGELWVEFYSPQGSKTKPEMAFLSFVVAGTDINENIKFICISLTTGLWTLEHVMSQEALQYSSKHLCNV